jgi:hypothetical protein
MSPPEIWGPPIWTFFHTLAEKVNEDLFPKIKHDLFFFIKRICSFLPCPECSQHAIYFLTRLNLDKIREKTDFIKIIYIFHNTVNKRKKKQLFNYGYINKYKNHNIITTFNNFIRVYHTKGNMNLLAESFQRSLLVKDLKNWLVNKISYFRPSINKQIQNPTPEEVVINETVAIEETTLEEAIVEEPVVEETIAEEAVVEEPLVEETVVIEETHLEESLVDETVVIEETHLEELLPQEETVLEESGVEETTVEEESLPLEE